MSDGSRMDYAKLLGFGPANEAFEHGSRFQASAVALSAAPTTTATTTPEPTKTMMPMDVAPGISEPGEPVMRGLDGKAVN